MPQPHPPSTAVLQIWARLADGLPSQCHICRAWPAAALCADCLRQFARPEARCERCAVPLTGGATVCGACLRDPPPMDVSIAAVGYQWPWTDCIAHFKFHQHTGLAHALAALLADVQGTAAALAQADVVLPLPLSAERLAERGYNQSLLLARCLAPQRTRADVLRRIRHTPPQRDLARVERLKNVRGAFAIDPLRIDDVRQRRVVLIDDVMTTGASLRAAAGALREAGAAHITALVLARTAEVGR